MRFSPSLGKSLAIIVKSTSLSGFHFPFALDHDRPSGLADELFFKQLEGTLGDLNLALRLWKM